MVEEAQQAHLNFALVEDVRPPMYTAMKYWGKKPHNIWGQFIERYCPPNGTVLDPFAGSAVAAFEALKRGRKVVAFDLNPLTAFIIEVLTSDFCEPEFLSACKKIFDRIEADPIYARHWMRDFNGEAATVFNYRWAGNEVTHLALEVSKDLGTKRQMRAFIRAEGIDKAKVETLRDIDIPFWFPTDRFPDTPTIKHKFVSDLGGDGFQYLWTRRNLYLLALIFNEIEHEKNLDLRLQLLFGFIQTLHLTSKMVVPRGASSNRDFSGSWGRADYMIRHRQMEQNPLVIFQRSCIDKQGVISALRDARLSLPAKIKIANINVDKKLRPSANLTYGILDVADLNVVPDRSIDFVITDPPYAGLVAYLDLSLVWLSWLQRLDKKYVPDLQSEITIKKGQIGRDVYRRRLQNAFQQLHRVLKEDGYLVVTFHHKKLQEWNDFVNAVRLAGFRFDKVTHQYNRRSGESNVANPYGTSGADFYIRCVKHRDVDFTDDKSGLEHFIVQKTIEIIAQRNEPTPYEFIIAGLVPELLQAGYMQPKEYQEEVQNVLTANSGEGKIFSTWKNNETKAGDYWWLQRPSDHINFPDRPLRSRIEESVLSILRKRIAVRFDDVIAEIFKSYPNGLTPDPRGIQKVLEKFAYQSAGKWKIKDVVLRSSTKHSEVIRQIAQIGKKAAFQVYVGRREQPELTEDGRTLREVASVRSLRSIKASYSIEQIARIEMVDSVWLTSDGTKIACIFEVENSTDFTAAIVRASNVEAEILKFMVIPPEREDELLAMHDPLFVDSFRNNNWRYITYESIARLAGFSSPSIDEFERLTRTL